MLQNITSVRTNCCIHAAATVAKSLQSCPTLCDPIDGSPPGSPIPGVLQPRTLEWVAISFSNAWKGKVKVKSLTRVRPSATPRTAAFQAPPSTGFSRQEYWSGVPYTDTKIIFPVMRTFKIYSLSKFKTMQYSIIIYSHYAAAAAAAAKSSQSCPTLCDPIDGSPPGSPVPGILQARTLEWLAVSFSNAWKGKVKVKSLSRVRLFATPWSSAYQAPPSMGFSRQEYWSGVPLYIPGTYFTTEHLYFLMFIISTKFLHKIQWTWKISLIRCCTGIFDSPPIKLYQLEKDTSDFWGNRFLPQSIQPSGINLLYKEIFKVFPQILSQCYCE